MTESGQENNPFVQQAKDFTKRAEQVLDMRSSDPSAHLRFTDSSGRITLLIGKMPSKEDESNKELDNPPKDITFPAIFFQIVNHAHDETVITSQGLIPHQFVGPDNHLYRLTRNYAFNAAGESVKVENWERPSDDYQSLEEAIKDINGEDDLPRVDFIPPVLGAEEKELELGDYEFISFFLRELETGKMTEV